MNYIILVLLFLCIRTAGFSQQKGINFEKNINWNQIKQKARIEKKYIFLDFFATWCAPCKAMDKEIYTSKKVKDFFEENFISIKVQGDTSQFDDSLTKSWYADAHKILIDYKVGGYPTFLFFSPEGKLVDKGIGYKDEKSILELAMNSIDPRSQYYNLLDQYNSQKLDFTLIPRLCRRAKSFNELQLARDISAKYINSYLLKLTENELFKKDNLEFITEFTTTTKSQGFAFLAANRNKVNTVIGDNKVEYSIRFAIYSDYLPNPETWKIKKPRWNKLQQIVTSKFGDLGEEVILGQQMVYFQETKNWPQFAKFYTLYFNKALKRPEYITNSMSWDIFLHISDPKTLSFAADVMKYALENYYSYNPGAVDTYANLLYKIGKTSEAIEWQEKAVKAFPSSKEYIDNLRKMKGNLPTW